MGSVSVMTEAAGGDVRLILVHGATSGPWVFDQWAGAFPGYDVCAPDLQEGLDVGQARMSDYVDRVLVTAADRPSVVCGWSMGGLVALMAAQRSRFEAVVVLEPSLPLELSGGDGLRALRSGTYDAESAYGPLPPVRVAAQSPCAPWMSGSGASRSHRSAAPCSWWLAAVVAHRAGWWPGTTTPTFWSSRTWDTPIWSSSRPSWRASHHG